MCSLTASFALLIADADDPSGMSLVGLGKAHCKLATLQETFAVTFEDTFLASIVRTSEEIKEYQKERKKLESRR